MRTQTLTVLAGGGDEYLGGKNICSQKPGRPSDQTEVGRVRLERKKKVQEQFSLSLNQTFCSHDTLVDDNKRKLVVCQVHLVHVEIMFIARSLYSYGFVQTHGDR